MAEYSVMRSILVNLQEPLVTDLWNTSKLSCAFVTMQTPQDISSVDNFSIVGWGLQTYARTIKEATFIRVNDPSLKRNTGKYQVSHNVMRSYSTPQTSNLNRHFHHFTCATCPLGKPSSLQILVEPGMIDVQQYASVDGQGRMTGGLPKIRKTPSVTLWAP